MRDELGKLYKTEGFAEKLPINQRKIDLDLTSTKTYSRERALDSLTHAMTQTDLMSEDTRAFFEQKLNTPERFFTTLASSEKSYAGTWYYQGLDPTLGKVWLSLEHLSDCLPSATYFLEKVESGDNS